MEIKLCSGCNGKGSFSMRERITNLMDEIKCNICNGSGRVIIKTYTLEFPFGFDEGKMITADKKMRDTMRVIKNGNA